MLTFEITKQPEPIKSFNRHSEELYRKRLAEFWGGIGEFVYFIDKNKPGLWEVEYLELDPTKVIWSKSGKTPYFILVTQKLADTIKRYWTTTQELSPYYEMPNPY
jgi:hypothetical protein